MVTAPGIIRERVRSSSPHPGPINIFSISFARPDRRRRATPLEARTGSRVVLSGSGAGQLEFDGRGYAGQRDPRREVEFGSDQVERAHVLEVLLLELDDALGPRFAAL